MPVFPFKVRLKMNIILHFNYKNYMNFFHFTDGVDYKLFHSLVHKTTFSLRLSNNVNIN